MTGCIIGSFRKHYNDIVSVIKMFEQAGIEILSPKVSNIINPGAEFVILESDDKMLTKEQIQAKVFENEKKSDFVYVWDPDGYIGRTTCYEIGRIIEQGDKPIYYKERPKDIPIEVDNNNLLSVDEVISRVCGTEKKRVLRLVKPSHRNGRSRVRVFARTPQKTPNILVWNSYFGCSDSERSISMVDFNMDTELKQGMESICEEMGLSLTTAFTIFAKKVINEKRIPFEIPVDLFYSERNTNNLKELVADIDSGKEKPEKHELIEG